MDKIDRYQVLKTILEKNWWMKHKLKNCTPEKLAENIMDCILDRYPDFFDYEIPKEVFGKRVIEIPWDDPEQIKFVIDEVKKIYMNCIAQWESNSHFGLKKEEIEARKEKYRECFIVYRALYNKIDEEKKAILVEEQKAKEKERRRTLYEKLKKEFEGN